MSVLKPKTIIIQPPCQYGSFVTSTVWDLDSLKDDTTSSDEESSNGVHRKRRRLTFLSQEEKMVRRKLKNRVAAQTARDRKKQRMTELEEMITILETKNKQLFTENAELRRSAVSLVEENTQLKQRLETAVKTEDCAVSQVATRKLSDSVSESAVLNTPQPRETDRTSLQLAAYWLTCLILWTIRCSNFSEDRSTTTSAPLNLSTSRKSVTTIMDKHQLRPPQEWWGRHQQNWNPLTN